MWLCQQFGVSRSGYYHWKKRPQSKTACRDKALLKQIRQVHQGNRKCYGSPRIYKALRRKGITCSRRRVARIMRENGIHASVVGLYVTNPKRYDHYQQVDNVLGTVKKPTRPNQQWVADFT